MSEISISKRLNANDNALNLIRLILAATVIVSHARPVGGFGPDPILGDLKLGVAAVGGFFTISGFLITRSRFRTALVPYAWRRFLRIMPGLWVNLVVTAFGFASIVGVIRGGWSASTAGTYAWTNADLHNGTALIGDTLQGAPFPFTWNGSLWTLPYEVLCYAVVALAVCVPFIRKSRVYLLAAFIASTVVTVITHARGVGGTLEQLVLLAPFFIAGAVLYVYADSIPLTWMLGVPSLGAIIVAAALGEGRALSPLFVAYACIWASAYAPARLRKIGARNDISYGMYLYGFPVQQLLCAVGVASWGLLAYTILGIAATVPFAVASWFLVENPANSLRRWRVGWFKPSHISLGAAVTSKRRSTRASETSV